ncbi:ATP-binding protein [Streptomyces sp. NPDC059816]|uniref:ATP-binding protein n=1 Tax=Streptomyces sp. NPDC059816 TaxID=3346960 RepID=UPI00365D4F2B
MHDEEPPPTGDTAQDSTARTAGPLDPAQLRRITSLHRGFTYQNLYAVGCLLRLREAGAQTLLMELDEDLEVVLPDRHLYLQVKTRQGNLMWSDISGSVEQFAKLRAEHTAGRRPGAPKLIVVSNTAPGRDLLQRTQQTGWPAGVSLLWPGHPDPEETWLPPTAADLTGVLQWCTEQAARVPFGSLGAQTLVWKLAARVQYASAGAHGRAFHTGDLASLYEQFVEELQAFPQVPDVYWPPGGEPELTGEQRVRLVTGFSGAGKTTWAARAAAQCPLPVTYFDAGQMPPAVVPGALAREVAARHLSGPDALSLPSGAGIDVLRAVHGRLTHDGTVIAVVIDNVHDLPSDDLRLLVQALPTAQITLLGHPHPEQTALAAHLGVSAESLPGWDTDTVAAVFAAEDCTLDYPTAQRVLALTAGMPLYVLNSAALTRTNYAGDGGAFCAAVQEQTHLAPTAQERILAQTFEHLSVLARTMAGLMAIAEVPLSSPELQQLAAAAGPIRPAAAARAVRELVGLGLVQTFADGFAKLHDAAASLALHGSHDLHEEAALRVEQTLTDLLEGHRELPRLARWMRLLADTGQIDRLLEITSQEGFYEGGFPRELRTVIADVAQDPGRDAVDRLDAHSALASWAYGDTNWEAYARHVHAMEVLASEGGSGIGPREQVLVAIRQFPLHGHTGDNEALDATFRTALAELLAPSLLERSLRYGYVQGLYHAGSYRAAGPAALELADAYCVHLGLDLANLHGPTEALQQACLNSETPEDYKRLADCFAMHVKCCRQLKLDYGSAAFPAMKLYMAAGAWRSAVDLGQDVVETMLRFDEAQAALNLIDRQLLPITQAYNLPELIVGLRSHRAVVLARTGDIAAARTEISSLTRYEFTPAQAADIREQASIIEELAAQQAQGRP